MKRYVELAPGGQVHLLDAGSGPTVLLLHPVPSSGAMWSPVLEPLARRGLRALALDLPGYGMSDPPIEADPTLRTFATAAASVLDALGCARCTAVGNHTGAAVALTLAADRPDLVDSLVLIGVPLFSAAEAARFADEQPAAYGADGVELRQLWRWRQGLSAPQVALEVARREVALTLLAGEHAPIGHWALGRADLASMLADTELAALCLAGERDALAAATAEAARIMRAACHVSVAGAGVDIADEQPELLSELITRWVGAGAGGLEGMAPGVQIDELDRP